VEVLYGLSHIRGETKINIGYKGKPPRHFRMIMLCFTLKPTRAQGVCRKLNLRLESKTLAFPSCLQILVAKQNTTITTSVLHNNISTSIQASEQVR